MSSAVSGFGTGGAYQTAAYWRARQPSDCKQAETSADCGWLTAQGSAAKALAAVAVADREFSALQVDLLDAQRAGFHQAQAGPTQERSDQAPSPGSSSRARECRVTRAEFAGHVDTRRRARTVLGFGWKR